MKVLQVVCEILEDTDLHSHELISWNKKWTQLKSSVIDLGEKAIIGISETLLTLDDDSSLLNVASSTHSLIICDSSQSNEKKKGDGVIHFFICPFKKSIERRVDLKLVDKC